MSIKSLILVGVLLLCLQRLDAGEQADESRLVLEGINAWLAVYPKSVILEVTDDVDGGCMPRPANTKAAWEAELRRLGFQVTEREPIDFITPDLTVNTLGYATSSGSCIVYVESILSFYIVGEIRENRIFTPVQHRIAGNLLSGAKYDMQSRIEDLSKDHARTLYLRMEKTRERFLTEYPKFMDSASE